MTLYLGANGNTVTMYPVGANGNTTIQSIIGIIGGSGTDTFTVNAGTDNWFQYQVTNACNINSPVSIGDPYFNTYAITGSVSQIVAPAGAAKVRYRLVYVQFVNEGGSCYFDSAVLNQTSGSIPPVIGSLFPLNMIFVNPGDGLSFTASSPDLRTSSCRCEFSRTRCQGFDTVSE